MNQQLDQITLRAGTVIHYRGMPFSLPADTPVEGRQANYDLVSQEADGSAQRSESSGDQGERLGGKS